MTPLELWGGVESSIVRIGDDFRNQLRDTAHWTRLRDLDVLPELGIKRIRYPILWEAVAPESPHERDFSWSDRRIARLEELGVKVIGTLVHHGSGRATPTCSIPTSPICSPIMPSKRRAAIPGWICGRRSTSR